MQDQEIEGTMRLMMETIKKQQQQIENFMNQANSDIVHLSSKMHEQQ